MRGLLFLALFALLAGCTKTTNGPSESQSEGDYDGGRGIAVAFTNNGTAPFRVVVKVLSTTGAELKEANLTVPAGGTADARFGMDAGRYDVQMMYQWEAGGRAASGQDEQRVDLGACEELTRIAWDFREYSGTVGSAYQGSDCASPG